MAEILIKSLTKIYDKDVVAVKNINLKINNKDFLVLVGPSGCGKSTTLRMIAGLEEITEGEIYIDGKLINNISPKDRDIAMVFQNYALYPHMTVYKNISFGLKLRKYSKKEIEKRVDEVAEILEIKHLLKRKPRALSGGQKQRVALGRAIVRKPKVFLFDEPLSNLDAKLRVQMRTEIGKLHKRIGTTMVYVTHDQTEAMTMGNRIVILKDGEVQQIDSPIKLYNEPINKFVAGFIGSPNMNFLNGKIENKNSGLIFNSENIKLTVDKKHKSKLSKYVNKDVIFGIRPEELTMEDATGKNIISFNVDIVEPLGNEILVYLNKKDQNIISRFVTKKLPKINSQILIKFNMKNTHYFDLKSKKNIIL